jgi:hypothetical protein
MWDYYAERHLNVSSRDTEKGSMFRVPGVSAAATVCPHPVNKAPESFNFPKLNWLAGRLKKSAR